MKKTWITQLAIAAALTVGGTAAFAAPTACTGLPSADTSDFTYRGTNATACQFVSGNDQDSKVDGLFGVADWDMLSKIEKGEPGSEDKTITINGLQLTFSIDLLSYNGLTGAGQYELVVSPLDSALLPLDLSLMGILKQANGFVAFNLSPARIESTDNTGTFRTDFWVNSTGKTTIDYSHVSFWGANYVPCTGDDCGGGGDDDNPVPEPGSLALVGLGLAAAGLVRRRRKAV